MNALLQSQIFFFVSSIGFIILGIFVGVLLFYLIRISRTFSRIVNKAEKDINNIGDTTKELLEELKESSLFQLIMKFFKKKKKYEKNKQSTMSTNKKLAVGAGIAAIGAGAYYLLGPDAQTHQKKTSVLIKKMQKEMTSKVKEIKEVTPPLYHKAIDVISENYAKQYKLHAKDIKAFASKLKKEWKNIKKVADKTIKTSKKKTR